MNKAGNKISKCIGVLFALYWSYTLLSVFILERSAAYRQRSYEYSNFVPALLIIALLAVLGWFNRTKMADRIEKSDDRWFYVILILVSAAVLLIQLKCMKYLARPLKFDFEHVRETAMAIGLDHTFSDQKYFNRYPNNLNILYVFSMIVRMFGDWQPVITIGIILVNLSVLLTAQISYKITGRKLIGFMTMFAGICLYDFAYRTFTPYTDNYGVLFLVIPLFVFFNKKKGIGWQILSAVSIALACFIKVTGGIFLIAGFIVICCLKLQNKKDFLKKALIFAVIFSAVYVGLNAGMRSCFRDGGYEQDTEMENGFWHYFMMGQNDVSLGSVYGDDVKFTRSFTAKTERDSNDREEGINRIKNRGISGNLFFYTYKNFQNYNDGTFSIVQKLSDGEKFGDSVIENIFVKKRPHFRYYALVEQFFWLSALVFIFFTVLPSEKKSAGLFYLKLVILGVSAYVLIFESRAKYLYMFVPVYLILAAIGMKRFLDRK